MFLSKKRPAAKSEETRTSSGRRPSAQAKPKKLGPIKNYAVWLLGRQDHSAADLERRFTMKGYPADEIQTCLQFLKEHAIQSDERFAGNRARSKSRGHGNRRIAMDLKAKGIDPELILGAVESLDEENDRAIAVSKKFAGKNLTQDLKTKIWRFMASRGFGSGAIKVALGQLQDQAEKMNP